MAEENHTVVREVSRGAASGFAPYLLIAGAIGLGYLYIKNDLNNTLGGISETAGSIIEKITDTTNNTVETVKETVSNVTEKVSDTNETIWLGGTYNSTEGDSSYTDPTTGETVTVPGGAVYVNGQLKSDMYGMPEGTDTIELGYERENSGGKDTTRQIGLNLDKFTNADWFINPYTGEKVYTNTANQDTSSISVLQSNVDKQKNAASMTKSDAIAELTAAITGGAVDNSAAKAASSKSTKTTTSPTTQSAKDTYKQGTSVTFKGSSKTSSGGGASLKGKSGVTGVKY